MTDATTRAPTLHDVAREAGVSLATASRVVNGSTRKVAGSYRDRVEAAALRLGYTANVSAQAIARGTSAVIALLVADIADPYFGKIAAGVARGADEAGLIVTISITERDRDREVRLVRALRGQRPRGIILAASRTRSQESPELRAELDAIARMGGRVVALGPGAGDVRTVSIDNRAGAHALGRTLAKRGYRHAVILGAPQGVWTSDERITGFTNGFRGTGGAVDSVYRDDFTREGGRRLMARAIDAGIDRSTIVFAVSDVVAVGALATLRERGRAAGSDIAVAGFDDIPTSRDVTPGLTTVRVPLEEVGYRAFRAAIDDDWTPPRPMSVEVVVRASTPGVG